MAAICVSRRSYCFPPVGAELGFGLRGVVASLGGGRVVKREELSTKILPQEPVVFYERALLLALVSALSQRRLSVL